MKVAIKAKIVDFVAEVTIDQKYVNAESNPIEVIYNFPIEEGAAVVDFTAEVEGKIINTRVMEKKKAVATYEKAVQVRKNLLYH